MFFKEREFRLRPVVPRTRPTATKRTSPRGGKVCTIMHRYKKENFLLFLGKMVKKNTKINVNNLCRNWGIFLVIASIIQFALPELFDFYWASIVLIIGITTLISRKSWNLALIGGMFLLVGAYNIIIV